MIFDHLRLPVANYEASKQFYTLALKPLGIEMVMEIHGWAGFGKEGLPVFWFGNSDKAQSSMHIAFSASSKEEVEAFYKAAVLAGGRDAAEPCMRPEYHPGYYGSYVSDPNGYIVEVVFHGEMIVNQYA